MEYISINDLPRVVREKNLKIISNIDGHVIAKYKNLDLEYILTDYLNNDVKVVRPDYNNSILNIVSSIKKYYGIDSNIKTNSIIDEILSSKKFKHISILLVDGMGSYILDENLSKDSFLHKYKVGNLSSIFPPTTACVIPALQSGLMPIETSWVGWENYFEEINKHVVMFKNTDYFTEEKLDFDVSKVLPYKKFYDELNVFSFEFGPKFHPTKCQSFDEMCYKFLEETHLTKETFSYLYWDEPDYSLHEFKSGSNEVKKIMSDIDKYLSYTYEHMEEDTLMIVTADHGHIDVKNIYLSNFKDLTSLLERCPSNEGRCAFFKVKPFMKNKFKKLFNLYFGSYFTLISKKEFLEEGYLGEKDTYHPRLDSFIGDFVGIAKKNYSFVFDPKLFSDEEASFVMKSHHAGITANELITPLIILAK